MKIARRFFIRLRETRAWWMRYILRPSLLMHVHFWCRTDLRVPTRPVRTVALHGSVFSLLRLSQSICLVAMFMSPVHLQHRTCEVPFVQEYIRAFLSLCWCMFSAEKRSDCPSPRSHWLWRRYPYADETNRAHECSTLMFFSAHGACVVDYAWWTIFLAGNQRINAFHIYC